MGPKHIIWKSKTVLISFYVNEVLLLTLHQHSMNASGLQCRTLNPVYEFFLFYCIENHWSNFYFKSSFIHSINPPYYSHLKNNVLLDCTDLQTYCIFHFSGFFLVIVDNLPNSWWQTWTFQNFNFHLKVWTLATNISGFPLWWAYLAYFDGSQRT